ncbi:MAG: GNAT family N-acetyltransferase [Gaiellaceae bacterium]
MTLPALRIGLEPGYDGVRFGAWVLDVPGAFGSATSRELAVSQSGAALGWFRDWVARHGEPFEASFGFAEVVEEVPASVVAGYERNATFAEDSRPVADDELATALRRLDFARTDLLALVPRLAAVDRSDTGAEQRHPDEVLRHLGGAETWLGSRLDASARFDGPSRNGDPLEYLAATRTWAVANLRRLHDEDAAPRTDGKGESWTLRKVVRRYVYHSVDHLRELDLRLARAEGRADRLAFRDDHLDDPAPLARLLRSVGWDRRAEDLDRLRAMLAGSPVTVTAWDGDELVGFAREHGDRVVNSVISMVCVDPRWQGLGIADRLVRSLTDGRDGVRISLHAAGGMQPYYARLGFEPDPAAMVRRRG